MTFSRRSKPLPRRGRPERSRGARFRQSPLIVIARSRVSRDRGNLIQPVTLTTPNLTLSAVEGWDTDAREARRTGLPVTLSGVEGPSDLPPVKRTG